MMNTEPEYINGREVLRYDFQGWPMFKQTVKDFLDELGIESISVKDESILNKPLVLKRDDGMAYCSKSDFVEDVCNDGDEIQLWYF